MERNAGRDAGHEVEKFRRDGFIKRVMALFFPTTD